MAKDKNIKNLLVLERIKSFHSFWKIFKKTVIGLLIHCLGMVSLSAQVGIGTNSPSPSAALEVAASDKGFLLPRMTEVQMNAIAAPAAGLMVYCMDCVPKGAYVFDGEEFYLIKWDYATVVDALDCPNATIDGILIGGTYVEDALVSLPYTGSIGGVYDPISISSTGVTGLVLSAPAGELPSGNGNLSFALSGTPSSDGGALFEISLGGQTCTLNIPVLSAQVSFLDCPSAVVSGSFVGTEEAYSVSVSLPYTGSNGGGFNNISIPSTGVTGLVLSGSGGVLAEGNGYLELVINGTPNTGGVASFELDFGGQNCTLMVPVDYPDAMVVSLDCSGAIRNGEMVVGNLASGVSASIPYTGGNGGLYDAFSINSTGVNGLIASVASGAVALNGSGTLELDINGTPTSAGTAYFSFSFGGKSCNLSMEVVPLASVTTLQAVNAVLTGNYTGGVEISDGVLTVPYTGGNGGVYEAFTISSTFNTGLTASISAGRLAIGDGVLTFSVTGTPYTIGITRFVVPFAGSTYTARFNVDKLFHEGLYYESIVGLNGGIWLDRNLGATRQATSMTDTASYGYYYQWGRTSDGHQLPTSTAVMGPVDPDYSQPYLVTVANPNNTSWYSYYSGNNTRWRDDVKTGYDPCPDGFRIPSSAVWESEMGTWGAGADRIDGYNNLKLPVSGARETDNEFQQVGSRGYYWTSTNHSNTHGRTARFFAAGTAAPNNDVYTWSHNKAHAFTVRCIKE